MYNLNYFIEKAKEKGGNGILGIAAPYTADHINAVGKSLEFGLIKKAYLIGEVSKIKEGINASNYDESKFTIVEATDFLETAVKLMKLSKEGKVNIIMKGAIDTSILLKEVLNDKWGLRTDKIMAHVGVMFSPNYPKYYVASDGGMNINPTLEQKKDIIEHAVKLAKALGNDMPKVAMLTAKEKPYDKMPCTIDAAKLQRMNMEGEIKDCIVSGPLQMDNAVDKRAAEIKGVKDPVAGEADIFIFPTIEVGNIFLKGLWKLANWTFTGLIAGAKLPIVLTSRADNEEGLLGAIAFSCLFAQGEEKI